MAKDTATAIPFPAPICAFMNLPENILLLGYVSISIPTPSSSAPPHFSSPVPSSLPQAPAVAFHSQP